MSLVVLARKPACVIEFRIEDNRENNLVCSVWEEHVQSVLQYYNSQLDVPVIVLLQLYRAKVDERTGKVKISRSYDATKIWFNHDCPEFKEFKLSLPQSSSTARSITSLSRQSVGITLDFANGKSLWEEWERFMRGIRLVIAGFVPKLCSLKVTGNGFIIPVYLLRHVERS